MADWFYEKDGVRVGPVDEAAIKDLIARAALHHGSLVWSASLGHEWRTLQATPLGMAVMGPPPLPATHVKNGLAWLLAFVPLIGLVVELVLGLQWDYQPMELFLGYFLINTVFAFLDGRNIKKSGHDTRRISYFFWIWLVPVYLFQRARALNQSKAYFWTWLVMFVLSLLLSNALQPGF